MSTFKCGLRRFDGHGTSSYRPTNTAATKEMESAFSRMMREREQQDAGCFTKQECSAEVVQKEIQKEAPKKEEKTKEPEGPCYSLSDSK